MKLLLTGILGYKPWIPSLEFALHVAQSCGLIPRRRVCVVRMREDHVEGFSCADGVSHDVSLVSDPGMG